MKPVLGNISTTGSWKLHPIYYQLNPEKQIKIQGLNLRLSAG
jgi:hypothetical protein